MTPRVRSFTEVMLLHPTVLEWLYPPDREKIKINPISSSVTETLSKLDLEIYSRPLIKTAWHWRTKPLRAIGRWMYTGSVLVMIAPLGVAVNEARAIWHACAYLFCKVRFKPAQAEAQKVKAYAKAFFTDLSSFISFPLSVLAICPDTYIPRRVVDSDKKVGMFLALALRNKLGLVGKDGGLLPFSAKDKVQYRSKYGIQSVLSLSLAPASYSFEGGLLGKVIISAEKEFIDVVRGINQILQQCNLPEIPFSYPFYRKTIERSLQEHSKGHHDLKLLMGKLGVIDDKVRLLKGLRGTAQWLTVEDRLGRGEYLELVSTPSDLSELQYKQHFNRKGPTPTSPSRPCGPLFSWFGIRS